VYGAEAEGGEGREHGRVGGDGGGDAVAAADAGADELVGVARVGVGAGGAGGGAPVAARLSITARSSGKHDIRRVRIRNAVYDDWRLGFRGDLTILAYEMNGEPLNELHGAPLRLRNELQLAFKQVKWIEAIEFVENFQHLGRGRGASTRTTSSTATACRSNDIDGDNPTRRASCRALGSFDTTGPAAGWPPTSRLVSRARDG
jgi:hypothetical protein